MSRGLLALGLLLWAVPVSAQNHRAIKLAYPSSGMNAAHKTRVAAPNVPFSYDAGAIGGTNVYTSYALSGAPAWMSIVAGAGAGETCSYAISQAATAAGLTAVFVPCGRVSGTPTNTTTDDDASYNIIVIDSDGASDTSDNLAIDVTTTPFKYVSSTGNNGNAGSAASPFLDMLAVGDASKVDATDVIYWCAGACDGSGSATFTVQCTGGVAQDTGNEARCEYNDGDGIPTQWLAYPGETITINFGYDGSGADSTRRIRFTAPHIYFDGFRVDNCEVMCFQLGPEDEGATFRNNTFLDLLRGVDGVNSAMIMTQGGQPPEYLNPQIVGNDFGTITLDPSSGAGAHIKGYSTLDLLVANNHFHDSDSESLALKESNGGYTVRYNYFHDNEEGVGGNMGCGDLSECNYGEVAYNNIYNASGNALFINQNNESGPVFYYRNTVRGIIFVDATASPEGPFTFTHNVVINGQGGNTIPYITAGGAIYAGGVVQSGELAGSSGAGIVDAFGLLQGAYITSNGPESANPRGFQFGEEGDPPPPASGPVRLRFRAS